MYSVDEYTNLTKKYGSYSSWAIWDYKKEGNLSVINQYIDQLHSRFILLALNISQPMDNKPWSNFHGGSIHDRKLKYACNDNELRGSYITDIFKGIVDAQSARFTRSLTDKIINDHINFFNQEMGDIKINDDSRFIILGTPSSILSKCFNYYFKQDYKNQVIYHYHYSYYGITDKEWVTGLWNKLNIQQDFDLTTSKYRQ